MRAYSVRALNHLWNKAAAAVCSSPMPEIERSNQLDRKKNGGKSSVNGRDRERVTGVAPWTALAPSKAAEQMVVRGGGKSERMKAAIFSGKGMAMARIAGGGGEMSGTGFLIHRNLLLTTHVNLPSVAAAEAAEIRLQSGVAASLFPHRFGFPFKYA
ncbi:hypothetical protein U1Q18_020483 [Sarracenia purpurea var. burkii]